MKYDHFIILNENTLSVKLADESKIIGDAIYSAQRYCSRFEDDKSLNFIRNGNINIEKNCTPWVVLSNGRYINRVNQQLFRNLIQQNGSEIIMLKGDNNLLPYREDMRIKLSNEVAGYRRFFFDSLIPDTLPDDWPNFTLIKSSCLASIIENSTIPARFCIFLKKCIFKNFKIRTYKIGSSTLDLDTEQGVLTMMNQYLNSSHLPCSGKIIDRQNVRMYGNIMSDENVRIEKGATIVGPAIIGENVTISSSATIYNSIIRPGTNVQANTFVRTKILGTTDENKTEIGNEKKSCSIIPEVTDNYRAWHFLSYATFGKRICDFLIALVALPWFSIIFIFIAAAIKITSTGPVLFKHKRQGLHGKTFSCLKFRTMIINADEIQEKLGFQNQVDGPQFKIENDPRVTIIGKFLRDTHIDELPQVINILFGQMSLIGPRPSPAKENNFCSYWRDARLSVRPGITGLWQMERTRESGQDFQEWIYYDTQYVKHLSLMLDLKIFFKTIIKLMLNFFKHL
ncbi:MAG: sugar transferase [Phycisphaerales bacterium]